MKTNSKDLRAGLFAVSILLLSLSVMTAIASAQNSGSENAGSAASVYSPSSEDSSSRPQHVSDALPDPADIRTGRLLPAGVSPLHWGKLSLVSFSLLDAYSVDNFNYQTGSTDNVNSAGLNALLSYDVRKAGFNFNVQYQPMVYFTDGNFTSEFSNQRFNVASARRVGLWVLQFSDNFYYLPANGQAAFGMSNGTWNGAGQNLNLVSGEKTLGNTFGLSTQRALNARDQLTLGANYQYYNVTGIPINYSDPSFGTTESTQNTFGFNAGLTHRLGWRSSIAVAYDFAHNNYSQFNGNIATASNYNAITTTYSFQPAQTVKISVGGGPAWLTTSGVAGNGSTQLTFQGNASITKTMRRSSISLMYGRNNAFNGVIANSLSEYVSLSLGQSITRKFSVSAGGGYARQLSDPISQDGWHGYAQLSYNLSRRWSLFGGFSTLSQTDVRSIYGNSTPKYASVGLTWSWGQSEDHN